ncbi:LacI family DNA-binding transcriptional regulator [Treponema parvum]|uniref:LacI family DNA-binding transcriptional regulator n=1 Tax=Treponema parvum TaxID=138851 RepID=A0A975F3I6_9SPIR|nr:LacI family DNA-binding transcriptional regulator [Treponema parvum]QTQ13682.1 LacI family DNA-binding transcriptional regulator [Treponema parvum]
MRPAKISDVAKLAKTSTATVSRVLSNSGYPVSNETAKRVRDAAEQLNYSPNLAGHMLKSRSAKTLGIIIPSLQNPFFIQLVRGIEDAAASVGYTTFVFNSRRSAETERELISKLQHLSVRGLLISSLDSNDQMIKRFLDTGAAAVIFESNCPIDFNRRVIDATPKMNENSALATRALLERNHRRIALLTTPLTRNNRKMVYLGYCSAMDEYNIPDEGRLVLEATSEREKDDSIFEFEVGKELGNQFYNLGKSFSGIVAVNDLVACGVIHELISLHVRIPEDVSVIGIDNIPQDIMITPAISSVDQDSYRHGYNACIKLINSLDLEEYKDWPIRRCYIPPKVIIRDSIKPLDVF